MSSKSLVWIGVFIGTSVGSAVPLLWGSSFLSFSSVILSGVGGVLGIWAGWKLSHSYF